MACLIDYLIDLLPWQVYEPRWAAVKVKKNKATTDLLTDLLADLLAEWFID